MMKEVSTKYYCDRCGAEVRPYGTPEEITSGYGYVIAVKGHFEPIARLVDLVKEFPVKTGSGVYGMALCPECMKRINEYLDSNEN